MHVFTIYRNPGPIQSAPGRFAKGFAWKLKKLKFKKYKRVLEKEFHNNIDRIHVCVCVSE